MSQHTEGRIYFQANGEANSYSLINQDTNKWVMAILLMESKPRPGKRRIWSAWPPAGTSPWAHPPRACRNWPRPPTPRWPAFPTTQYANGISPTGHDGGMTLRQYAAIHLKVPNSGTDWLDDMIREAQRDDIAAKALMGMMASRDPNAPLFHPKDDADYVYAVADAMLRAREAK